MGSKATITNFYFWPSFKFYFCLPHTHYAAKNLKPSKSGVKFFGPVPKSPTQMGSRSAKNASENFSCLGIFNYLLQCGALAAGFFEAVVSKPMLGETGSDRCSFCSSESRNE
jgi:hypothetical protein